MKLLLAVTLLVTLVSASRGQLVHSFCSTSQSETLPGQCRPVIKCISFFQNLRRLETKFESRHLLFSEFQWPASNSFPNFYGQLFTLFLISMARQGFCNTDTLFASLETVALLVAKK